MNFKISESEKQQILEMHRRAVRNNLWEQNTTQDEFKEGRPLKVTVNPIQFELGGYTFEVKDESPSDSLDYKFIVYRKKTGSSEEFVRADDKLYNNNGNGWNTQELAQQNVEEYFKLKGDFNDAMEKKQTPSQQTTNQ